MLGNILHAIWLRGKLTWRCASGGGWPFMLGLALDTISQVVQILSIFVPLKVIYIVGSGAVPSYLATFWPSATLSQWAWSLTLLTIVLFLMSASFGALGGKYASMASRRLVDDIAANNPALGRKVLRALRGIVVGNFSLTTDMVICSFFFALVFFVDRLFSGILLGVFVCALIVMAVVAGLSRQTVFFHTLWHSRFSGFVEGVFLFFFVVFFVVLVAVVLGGYQLGFLRSLIILILSRRLFQVFERAVKRHRAVMRKQGIEWLL